MAGTWKAAGSNGNRRWTESVTGGKSESPDAVGAPENCEFVGDWKIVTGGTARDAYGWEYTLRLPPVRRRVWLRTVQPYSKKKKKKSRATSVQQQAQQRRVRPRRKLPAWAKAVKDDFNFKGFGWIIYQSFIFAESFGVALSLPLTFNFDTWERHPALPSISSSACVFNPGTAILFLNASLRVEWIKWVAARLFTYAALSLWLVLGTFFRGLLLAFSAALYPFTRRLYDPPWTRVAAWPDNQADGPTYSRTTEERLGVSVSWRVSVASGYEFRISYWHFYAPTVNSLWDANPLKRQLQLPAWFARHSAALGMSTSAPMPDPPYVSCTGLLSLSGFYFRKAAAAVAATATTTTAASATEATTGIEPTALSSRNVFPARTHNATAATALLELESSDQKTKAAAVAALKSNKLLR